MDTKNPNLSLSYGGWLFDSVQIPLSLSLPQLLFKKIKWNPPELTNALKPW